MADVVRFIIIDSSVTLKRTVSIKLTQDASLQLVAATSTPFEAADKIKFFKPSVIVLGIDRIDPTNLIIYEKFIRDSGTPMVIVTNESARLLHLRRNVRIEFVSRPPIGDIKLNDDTAEEIFNKIKRIQNIPAAPVLNAGVAVPNLANTSAFQNVASGQPKTLNPEIRSVYQIQKGQIVKPQLINSRHSNRVIAIGSSTGGTEAVFEFLTKLPQDMPPILIVQHMPPVFTRLYADRLNLNCKMEVREAADGDTLYPGLALVAQGDKQMGLTRRGGKLAVLCSKTEKVSGHCPSVDFLFETVADTMGHNAIGIIMTGMGKDGAIGMTKMHNKGAYTIGQDQDSCVVYGMPKAAYEAGAVDVQAPPAKIPGLLEKVLSK